MTGAQFEIRIDGTPRTCRDRKDLALQGAQILKARNPNSVVRLKDLQTGRDRHRTQAALLHWSSRMQALQAYRGTEMGQGKGAESTPPQWPLTLEGAVAVSGALGGPTGRLRAYRETEKGSSP